MDIKLIPAEEYHELISVVRELKTSVEELRKSKSDPLGDPLLHIDEVSAILKITKRAIYTLRQEGKLAYIQQPGSSRIYFRASAVNEYLNNYQHKAFNKSKSF